MRRRRVRRRRAADRQYELVATLAMPASRLSSRIASSADSFATKPSSGGIPAMPAAPTSVAVNATGMALAVKHFSPLLGGPRPVFAGLTARLGSIGDNHLGGWHGYRASKAALNQLIRCFAIELARSRPQALCVGLPPGTVDTGLSKPFQRGVAPEKLFTPDFSARALLGVLDALDADSSGGLFAWDGTRIPY